ncbi:tRNA guanosine-2'-O-methyltransferase [Meira miltonrushii]|uniref:tRNA (guanine(10)-N(2))-methyltransferase n=1 Tax=Meira miltonrushii TaxID=1280837 RepID=A0A316VB11_9BASI|nr:tRNA guanosine-2'-O-methyltransferase [Meira miltonrushii]PWN34696.1 tRNA guanosine-2'-O-methyltransferase [Meira miltonrushii]
MLSRGLKDGESPESIGPLYLIQFANHHVNFRWAEFQAAAEYHDVKYCFSSTAAMMNDLSITDEVTNDALDTERVFASVHLANDDVARKMAERAICIRSVWQHWASANTLESLLKNLSEIESVRKLWKPYQKPEVSWKATVAAYMHTLTHKERLNRIEAFADVLAFKGPINLQTPMVNWCYSEEWTEPNNVDQWEGYDGYEKGPSGQNQRLIAVHTGRKICDGIARDLIGIMDVKKRAYIGNTTMESSMSLVQASMALAGPGKLFYDPFAGTGSLLLAAAAYGAHVLASDIDARMMRGKNSAKGSLGILRSAKQYGTEHLFIDSLCFDVTQHPLRKGGLFDAIVADPPYGIRAGAKKLGKRRGEKMRDEPFMMPDGQYSHERPDYHPPSKPYALDELLCDLMEFSAKMLVPKGRLVFWMPTMTDVECDDESAKGGVTTSQIDLQLPPTKHFKLIAHSLQDFTNWGRRLITLEKIDAKEEDLVEKHLVLPAAPINHVQSARDGQELANTNEQQKQGRAIDDLSVFRDQYFRTLGRGRREAKEAQKAATQNVP